MFSLLTDGRTFLEVSVAIGSPTNNVRETLLRRGRSETLFFSVHQATHEKKKRKNFIWRTERWKIRAAEENRNWKKKAQKHCITRIQTQRRIQKMSNCNNNHCLC